jgi:mono/diheme cytochrome c family protein
MFKDHRISGTNWSNFTYGTGFGSAAVWRKPAALLKNSSRRRDNMQTKIKQLGTLTLAGMFLAGTCLLSAPAKADTAAGAAAFKAKCAGCHGTDGKGNEVLKTPDMAGAEVQKKSDADLSSIITNGKGKMPAFKTLTPEEVKDLVSYIRSLKK